MIAYHILCHDNIPQVAALVESLYSEDDVFLIDIDPGKKPRTRALNKWTKLANVHVNVDANVGWGASGILRKTIQGAYKLLDLDQSWSYYINLSGQDLPLKSNTEIKRRLAAGAAKETNFIRCFKAECIDLDSLDVDNTGIRTVMWGDRGHTRVYAKPGAINPQVNWHARTFVDVAEAGEDGAVYFGTVDPLLHEYRSSFFKKYPFHIGSNWCNLHRGLLETMRDDPFSKELYNVLKTTSNPDESFFQTYIMNSPFKDRVSKDYSRLIVRPGPIPRVKIFDRKDWGLICESNDMFGRKFDTRKDRRIVRRVLAARAETGQTSPHKSRDWFSWFRIRDLQGQNDMLASANHRR